MTNKLMKYNTPRQRIKIYERLIRKIDKGELFFICNELHSFVNAQCYFDVEILFPEIWEVRPKGWKGWGAWYSIDLSSMKYRKMKLLKAIRIAQYNCL